MNIKTLASGSKGNCYYLNDGSAPLLIEAGISVKEIKKRLGFGLSEIEGCLISHSHKDHCKSVKDLTKAGIDCYMSHDTEETIGFESHRINIIEPKQQFKIGSWSILPFDLQHDVPNLGFLLYNGTHKVLYLTDTAYCKYIFSNLTHILIECNFSETILNENVANGVTPLEQKKRTIRSHMSVERVKDFMRANDLSQVEEIHLLHLSDDNSDSEDFKRQIQAATGKMVFVAGEGLK